MKNKLGLSVCNLLVSAIVMMAGNQVSGDTVEIVFGTNTATIDQVVFEGINSVGDSFMETQDDPDNTGSILAQSALLQSITLSDSTVLENFSFLTPTVTNTSFPTDGVVEVFADGLAFQPSDPGFLDALASVHSDNDLASYIRVDGTNTEASWNIEYGQAIDNSGYFLVQERDGNTDFSLTALDANGNTIGDTLAFDEPSYQWDTSIQNSLDPIDDAQSQELVVVELALFNTTQDIHGFEIVDSGNADFKFSFASVAIEAVPEPGSGILLLLVACARMARRHRQTK